ncbi:unnamed protein product, partial [Candidula unifasciata]
MCQTSWFMHPPQGEMPGPTMYARLSTEPAAVETETMPRSQPLVCIRVCHQIEVYRRGAGQVSVCQVCVHLHQILQSGQPLTSCCLYIVLRFLIVRIPASSCSRSFAGRRSHHGLPKINSVSRQFSRLMYFHIQGVTYILCPSS